MKRIKGQSIVELIIALVLVSVVLTAVVGLIIKSVSNNTFNKNKSLATSYAEETLEWLRSDRDANWPAFYTRTATTTWCTPSLSWSNGSHSGVCGSTEYISGTTFIRQVTFQRSGTTPVSINTTVTVQWSDSSGVHSSQSTTNFTNWKGNQ